MGNNILKFMIEKKEVIVRNEDFEKKRKIDMEWAERDLFKTVYDWGRVGIITDQHCNTFQELLARVRN